MNSCWTCLSSLQLLLLSSQVLAFNPRYNSRSISWSVPDNTELEISQSDNWKNPALDIERTKEVQEDMSSELKIDDKDALLNLRKPLYPNQGSLYTWWPSKADSSESNEFNEIRRSSIAVSDPQGDGKKPATFEELEERNANIYNPLLNLDHHPIPSKKYTFEELEDMNANQYNPYLN